jgi:hypothetical protein
MTYHHVLTSISKSFIEEIKPDIILCNTIPNVKNLLRKPFLDIFNKIEIYDEINIRKNYELQANQVKFPFRYIKLRKNLKNALIIPNIEFSIYHTIFLYHDSHMISYLLRYLKINYILAEDGINHFKIIKHYFYNNLNFFQILKKHVNRILFSKFYNLSSSDGTSYFIKHIEMNSMIKMSFKKKTILLNKNDLFDKLSSNQKSLILSIFMNKELINDLMKIDILLLTEPLLIDNRVNSVDIQELIYKEIINHYKNTRIAIKPHPRDIFDYSSSFKEIFIINKDMPVEILSFVPKVFESVITINSSSIDLLTNFKNKIKLYDKYNI